LGTRVQLDGSASADTGFGEIAGYSWRQISGAPVTVQDAEAKLASFMAPSTAGTVELELTVRDAGGSTATDRIVVTIAAGGPGGGGSGGGNGDGEGDVLGDDVYGGCAAHTGGTGPALLVIGLGLLFVRRRRR
jgi:MYXO-CTERM domain-containing protein